MKTRALILAVAVSLFGSACSPDDPNQTTTTGNGTSTTAGRTTTTAAGSTTSTTGGSIDLEDYPIPTGTVCFYLTNYLAVSASDVPGALEILNGNDIAAALVDADDVLNATADPEEGIPEEVGAVATRLAMAVGFLEVVEDPLRVSLALRDRGFQASPIHAVGFTSHIRFQPGTDPSLVAGLELPDVSNTRLDGEYVAVVDSGIVPPNDQGSPNPNWFYGRSVGGDRFVLYDEPVDSEQLSAANPASHGTFVTGLIRQIAPSKRVTFAAARLVNTADPDVITAQGEVLPPGLAPTSEIHVAEAMTRLMLRHSNDEAMMTALNLSLGAYSCDPVNDADLVTLEAASSLWLGTFQTGAIMAAAGNEDHPIHGVGSSGAYVPFWPAALSSPASRFSGRFHAVAAVDRAGTEIVWVNKAPVRVTTPPGRPWVTDKAPGADLVNLSGGLGTDGRPALVCWSGSSFATAVASAQVALDTVPATPDYNLVPGLTFVESEGGEVVTVGESSTTAAEACDHNAED